MAVHQPPGKLPSAIHKKPEPDRDMTMSRCETAQPLSTAALGYVAQAN